MLDISTIVLTYNEELHIRRCLENARRYAQTIYVVDSFSTDRTVEIAKEMGAVVVQHPWTNYSEQFAWALRTLPIATEWVWRQDADEYLSDALIEEISERLPQTPDSVSGFTAPCLRIFMGRYIKHGIVPLILLRLFRFRDGHVEEKMMDEHIAVSGKVETLKAPFYDDNLNGLTWWTQKHNGYATREAIDLLMTEYGLTNEAVANTGAHSMAVRRKKLKYCRLPLFWRAFAFFVYRYIFRLGFLDGKEGFLWHFLQGFWYRSLADAKVYEMKKKFGFNDNLLRKYLINKYITKVKSGGVKRTDFTCRLIPLRPTERRAYAA